MEKICNCYGSYQMCIEYDAEINAIKITSTNFETNETVVNVQLGNIGDLVKFDKDSVDEYVSQAWGGALPAYDNRIGFIFSKSDLDLRKHLLTLEDYEDILNKFPKLEENKLPSEMDINNMRIVFAGTSQELDITTGEPKLDSQENIVVDNEINNWFSKLSVEPLDITKVLPGNMVNMVINAKLAPINYIDPIEKDIWNKYTNKNE